ncbi:MAG: DUF6870 family protein [Rikenellaceae bacterium]
MGEQEKMQLVDIRDIQIDTQMPLEQRIQSYLEQIKNPYICRYGNLVIESTFGGQGQTLTECMQQLVRASF